MQYWSRPTKNRQNCKTLFEWPKPHEFISVDTETTGTNPDIDRIVEFSAIKYAVEDRSMKEVDRMDMFIQPPFKMDDEVISVHHITNEFLEDKPSEAEAFPEIKEFLGDDPIIVGQNVEFDVSFIEKMYARIGLTFNKQIALDTLEMARDIICYKDIQNFKLESLADYYGFKLDTEKYHSSIFDAEITARLLYCLYNEYANGEWPENLEKLYINYMYFSKGHNREQQGLYVNTNLGTIYYSTSYKVWGSTAVDVTQVDLDDLENQVTKRLDLNMKEVGRLTEKKYEQLKSGKGKKWL